MQLRNVYQYFDCSQQCPEHLQELELLDLFLDSRQVTTNSVFIAIQGYQSHGKQFIAKAISQGASLVIIDVVITDEVVSFVTKTTAILYVPDLAKRLGAFASWFYNSPSQRIKVVGITGTNGKTSTAFYTAQLLQNMGEKVALMGTLGNGLLGEDQGELEESSNTATNTTSDVVSLNRCLNEFITKGASWCVMEVSSHAIVLQRIAGLHFTTVALTQVTRDHLDFHGSIAAYHAAKRQLFLEYPSQSTVINLDDKQGRLIQEKTATTNLLSYGIENSKASLNASELQFYDAGVKFLVSYQHEKMLLDSPLMASFNVENLLCALSILLVNGKPLSSLQQGVVSLKPVAGRIEKIQHNSNVLPTVIIDYAHTPDALESVLQAMKEHIKTGKLTLVFGCGGDRDKTKRPLMGKIAEKYADKVVITNDNPRTESAEQIVENISVGMMKPCEVILDRKQAIECALQQAKSVDIVLIAGKGHEDYQELNGVRIPFSDKKVVERVLYEWIHE